MPRKPKATPAELPAIPAELLGQFGNGPMTADAINAATLALKKALIERALGGEMNHHLGYSSGAAKPAEVSNRDRFSIRDAESPGDGTVPHESGLAPGKRGGAIEQFAFDGFDHQSAYLPEMANVMAVTKYAIAKIAQKADWGDV
ncbi:hypothetical protein BCC0238_000803 [Burkholderia gladioli]|jgi:hypothetical protein